MNFRQKENLKLASFVGFGFMLGHGLHIYVYWSGNPETTIASWFSMIHHPLAPSVSQALIAATILSALASILVRSLATRRSAQTVFKKLVIESRFFFGILIASQLISSSVIRGMFECSILLIPLASGLLNRVFLNAARESPSHKELYERLWDLMRMNAPLLIGFPIFFSGIGALSSFYGQEGVFMHKLIYRHLACSLYFAGGVGRFITWPILRQILVMHEAIYCDKEASCSSTAEN